ncbi:MAG: DUF433 domain-containing protein [Armatimonadetes bacterium]|nr:DUF433 domain-containing protein [Armatimonadota bacterium]
MARSARQPAAAPAIRHTPGVCGGDACIGNHRIPVWVLEILRREGVSDAEILLDYPALTAADLAAAWAYADTHRGEMDRSIEENEQE